VYAFHLKSISQITHNLHFLINYVFRFYLLTYLFTYLFTYLLIYLLTYLLTNLLTYLLIYLLFLRFGAMQRVGLLLIYLIGTQPGIAGRPRLRGVKGGRT
jgi:hypothetical protein